MRDKRLPFDPKCDFVYLRPLKVGGEDVAAGKLVDRRVVMDRRLRQMYDKRLIDYAPGQSPALPRARPLTTGPTVPEGTLQPPAEKKRVVRRLRSLPRFRAA